VFISEDNIEKRLKDGKFNGDRYFTKDNESLVTSDGVKIFVSNQWGTKENGPGNFDRFLQKAHELNFEIKEKEGLYENKKLMSNLKNEYELWDEFLEVWPISRVKLMTLDDYTQAGSKDSFTYWIESRLDKLGSIWGGSSFKFGVFSRKDTDDKESNTKLSYSDTHGWYSTLGTSAVDAFEEVRGHVVRVASLAAQGDLEAIEAFEHLGEAYKWKIAFHYQNRALPTIIDIFKKAPLAIFMGETTASSMGSLQKNIVSKRPVESGILEFGKHVWEAWSQKNLVIWKLSHGSPPIFTDTERQQYLESKWVMVHRDTGKKQGKKFIETAVGTLFYLCHGNSPQRICQFTTDVEPCEKGDGWLKRRYRVLKPALRTDRYTENSKYWSPQGNSTFGLVGADDLPEFESTLLKPYFGTDLAELAGLAGEPVEDANLKTLSSSSLSDITMTTVKKSNSTALNRIYYGPPGTGKTYELQKELKQKYTDISVLPDKQSWLINNLEEFSWFEIVSLVLLDENRAINVADIVSHEYYQLKIEMNERRKNITQTAWAALQTHTVQNSTTVNYKRRTEPAVFDKDNDSRWFIVDSQREQLEELSKLAELLKAGPQQADSIKRFEFVTFHQSYGYEEFVEGLRPISNDEGDISYEIKPGVFKRLCKRAEADPDNQYSIVIDEINRGNISKIFGELITLVEIDKRAGAENELTVTLPYSGLPFSVPSNLDIIGTMNTADRSLTHIDVALRRRFEFIELRTNYSLLSEDVEGINVRRMLYAMNQRIELLLDRDHVLGHALLMKVKSVTALELAFKTSILPLLEEYFFDNWEKIDQVLNTNGFVEEQKNSRKIWLNDTDEYAAKTFNIKVSELSEITAYTAIYEGVSEDAFAELEQA